jgi:Tol biopolymer transport system component
LVREQQTQYSFLQHKKSTQIRVLDIESGQSKLMIESLNASEPAWLGDDEFLYLKTQDKGFTSIFIDSVLAASDGGQRSSSSS